MGMTGNGDSYINTTEHDEMKNQTVILVGNYSGNKGGTASLTSGTGNDLIYAGDGDDSIKGADSNDTVRIEGGMTLSYITKIDVTNNSVALEFKDGGSLNLDTNNETKFKIEGATYSYDKNSDEWKKL